MADVAPIVAPASTAAPTPDAKGNIYNVPVVGADGKTTNYSGVASGISAYQQAMGSAPASSGSSTSEPSVLSSSNVDDKNAQNVTTAATKSANPSGQSVGDGGFVRNADQSFAEAPSGAKQVTDGNGNQYWTSNGMNYALGSLVATNQGGPTTNDAGGRAIYSDGTFAPAPAGSQQSQNGNWYDSNGNAYGAAPTAGSGAVVTSDPATQAIYDQFTQLKGQMDATGAANIGAIQDAFKQLISEQQQSNAGTEAGTYSILARGGSLQTGSSGGIFNAQVSYGLQQVADLVGKENSAVIAAQQAMQDNDYKILDEQLQIAQKAYSDRQAAASKLNDAIQTATAQTRKDNAINGVIQSGVTDPSKILSTLQAQGNDTISLKDITDTISALNPDQADVYATMKSAAANGAPQSVISAISSAKTLGDALAAAGQYATDPTSLAGEYQAAVRAGYHGTPGDWVAAQKYKEAYASASASQQAAADFTDSSAGQQKLFQQGVTTLKSELSNRSGGLGIQDAKVNQAIHLKALLDQYKTTKTVQNTGWAGQSLPGTHVETAYNIPRSQYTELAMGLASLISPTNTVAEGTINKITQDSAAGDINSLITYVTGVPQSGSTNQIFQNIADSVDRQGSVAESERQTYVDDLLLRLPPGLSQQNVDRLTQSAGLNSYINPSPSQMSPAQIDSNAYSKIQTWANDPNNAKILSQIYAQYPDASNVEVAEQLGLIASSTNQ